MNDAVEHPAHYTFGSIEVIDAIESWDLPYHLANVVKYITRAGKKEGSDEITDLRKASWYLKRYIGLVEKRRGQDTTNS